MKNDGHSVDSAHQLKLFDWQRKVCKLDANRNQCPSVLTSSTGYGMLQDFLSYEAPSTKALVSKADSVCLYCCYNFRGSHWQHRVAWLPCYNVWLIICFLDLSNLASGTQYRTTPDNFPSCLFSQLQRPNQLTCRLLPSIYTLGLAQPQLQICSLCWVFWKVTFPRRFGIDSDEGGVQMQWLIATHNL